jgi:subfamily B ATP-binding cassette protein MsbA
MHVLKLLRQLLHPQGRRVRLLFVIILGATVVEIALWPGALGALFQVLDPKKLELDNPWAKSAFLQHIVASLNAVFLGSARVRLEALFVAAALLIVASVLRAYLTYSREYLGQYIGGRVLIELRMRLFERLQGLSLTFYESQRVGDLMSRLTNDVALVQQMITADMTNYLTAPFVVATGLIVMFVVNWRLSLFLVVFAPLTAFVVARTGGRIGRLTTRQQERIADLNARLHERLSAIRIIQSFVRERYESEKFRRLNEDTFDAVIRVARLGAFAPQAIQCISTISVTIVAIYAGVLMIQGRLAIPGLVLYFALAQRVGYYFVKFGALHLRVKQSLAALQRIADVLAREPDVQERPDALPLSLVEGAIAFNAVSLRYSDGTEVLRDIDLDIAPGEIVALVGPSGAGKTSLANLIMRFYDPTQGRIEIDGRDLRTVTLSSLRSQIGLVPQETILFGGTIKENILYGRDGATDDQVIEAAVAANAHEFITRLPEGYETEVGERGVKLSGGQRQRLAVARALLKDPRILILDEATSSLDAESEVLVQDALERLMKGRTTLIIAHRLSTIRQANRILVLADGRIVETGSHTELLAREGAYHRLYGLQQQGLLAPEPPS